MGKRIDKGEEEQIPSFSLNDFKKWMESQNDTTGFKKGVMHIESRLGIKKLLEKIQPEDGELLKMAKDFHKNGGVVAETDGRTFLVEVASGTFTILRNYVRRV